MQSQAYKGCIYISKSRHVIVACLHSASSGCLHEKGAPTVLSQPPLTIVSGAGQTTEDTACECPLSCCFEASAAVAEGAAVPAAPFFRLAPASRFAVGSSLAAAVSATPEPAVMSAGTTSMQCCCHPRDSPCGCPLVVFTQCWQDNSAVDDRIHGRSSRKSSQS